MNFLELFPAINNSSLKTYENILNTYICFTTLKTIIKNAGYHYLKLDFLSFLFRLLLCFLLAPSTKAV